MRMTRWISLALVAVVALAVAGIAVAHGGGSSAQPTEPAQASFTTTPVPDKTKTKQCTGVDGTYAITKAVDQGEVTSADPRLAGKLTVKSKSVVNTTNGLGWIEGNAQTRDATTGKLKGESRFTAVITEGSKLEGLIVGKVKSPAATTPKAKEGHGGKGKLNSELLANFTATAAQDGSVSGEYGSGASNNTAIIHGNPCAPEQKQGNAQKDDNHGHGNDGKGDDHRGGRGGDDDPK
jgi:hypothetical protein